LALPVGCAHTGASLWAAVSMLANGSTPKAVGTPRLTGPGVVGQM
jgi:hypothetical protein